MLSVESDRESYGKTQQCLDGDYLSKYSFGNMRQEYLVLNEKKEDNE